ELVGLSLAGQLERRSLRRREIFGLAKSIIARADARANDPVISANGLRENERAERGRFDEDGKTRGDRRAFCFHATRGPGGFTGPRAFVCQLVLRLCPRQRQERCVLMITRPSAVTMRSLTRGQSAP